MSEKTIEEPNPGGAEIGGVRTPNINPKTLKVGRKAIRDGEQANEIGIGLEHGNSQRNDTNAIIVAQYDGEQPFSESDLSAAGEDYRNNFPTGFMSGIIDRVTPTPVSLIDAARFLTTAKLDPIKFKEAEKKSRFFQERFTKLVRSWANWRSFIYALCQEEVLMGYAIAAWTDPYDWRPKFYRSDQAFVPEGTEQHASTAQALDLKQAFLIHELVEIIADREAAEAAKWDVENCVDSINHAMPRNLKAGEGEMAEQRVYEDAIREGNRGSSYQNGAKVINVRHVFAVEPNTKADDGVYYQRVTHYIIDRDSKKTLLAHEDRFESMPDVLTLFTLQPGNGKFYGSRGLGKILVNIHIAIERTRNIAADQLYMSGLLIMHDKDSKGTPTIQLKVRHPFALISSGSEISQEKIVSNIEEYMKLDERLTSIAEQAANAYIPNKLSDDGSGNRTATEAQIDNARDQQAKVAYLARFWGQLSELITSMQRKACNPETIDPEALEFQKDLKEYGFTEKEIEAISNTPAAEVQDLSQMNDQKIIVAAQALMGNPHIDQMALLSRWVSAMTSPQIADELILPDQIDPTIEAENTRQQLMENEMFMLGASMIVSPRDADEVHLKVGLSQLEDAAPKIAQIALHAPEIMDHIGAALMHFKAHIDQMRNKGVPDEEIQPYQESVEKAAGLLHQLGEHVVKSKQAEQAQQQQAQQTPSGAPAGVVPADASGEAAAEAAKHEEAIDAIISTMKFDTLPGDVQNYILKTAGLPESQMNLAPPEQSPGGAGAPPPIAPIEPLQLPPLPQSALVLNPEEPDPISAPEIPSAPKITDEMPMPPLLA